MPPCFHLTFVRSQSFGPSPARLVGVSFSVQKREGNLESSQLSGSQSPEHLNNSGASQGIVPNGRKKNDIKNCDRIHQGSHNSYSEVGKKQEFNIFHVF